MNPEDRTCQSFNALQANFYQLTCLEKQMNSLASKWKNRETQVNIPVTYLPNISGLSGETFTNGMLRIAALQTHTA